MFLSFRPEALEYWYRLPLWQRERVAEALVSLLVEPRPPGSRAVSPPETTQIWAGDRRILCKIFKDDQGADQQVVVWRV